MDIFDAKRCYEKGYRYFCMGEYKKSTSFFEKSLKYNYRQIHVLKFKGIAHYILNEHQQAFDHFDQAIKVCKSSLHATSIESRNEILEHVAEVLYFNELMKLKKDKSEWNRPCSLTAERPVLEDSKKCLENIVNTNRDQEVNDVFKKLGIVCY